MRLAGERSETRVRGLLADLDARIDAWNRGPQEPPVYVRRFDVEARLAQWRDARAAAAALEPVVVPSASVARRRWLFRRRRS